MAKDNSKTSPPPPPPPPTRSVKGSVPAGDRVPSKPTPPTRPQSDKAE